MTRSVLIFLSCFFASCSTQYSDFFPCFDDGTPKPSVAFLPITNAVAYPLPYDVTKELTNEIRYQLMKDGRIFMPPPKQVAKQMSECSTLDLNNSKDLMPFLYFQPEHFVVTIELISFEVVPYKRGQFKPLYVANIRPADACVLTMKARMKIVDIRGSDPKVIRQEIIQSNHMLEKGAFEASLRLKGTKGFQISPVGLAQARFVRDIVEKIEHNSCF